MGAVFLLMFSLACQDLDASDLEASRKVIEAAIRKGDEASLEAAAKTSRGARLALAELRAHRRFGDSYPMPPSVTLNVKEKSAHEVVERISQAIGIKIDVEGGVESLKDVPLTLDLRDANAFETLDALSAALNRGHSFNRSGVYLGVGAPLPRSRNFTWRHSRIDLSSLHEYRNLLDPGNTPGYSAFSGGARTDGLMRFVGHAGFRLDEVVEDTGKIVPPDNRLEPSFGEMSQYSGHGFMSWLKSIPTADSRRLTVRGAWVLYLPEGARFETLPLNDLTKVIESNNVTLRIDSTVAGISSVTVSARIGDRHKAHVPPRIEDFKLIDEKGRSVAAAGSVKGPAENPILQLEFQVPEGFHPTALSVRVFRSVGELDAPFEFRDLPIR